jgi:hypothetical protein
MRKLVFRPPTSEDPRMRIRAREAFAATFDRRIEDVFIPDAPARTRADQVDQHELQQLLEVQTRYYRARAATYDLDMAWEAAIRSSWSSSLPSASGSLTCRSAGGSSNSRAVPAGGRSTSPPAPATSTPSTSPRG